MFVYFSVSDSPDGDWRVGMAVTTKIGKAVVRNRVKRVLRECFRLNQMLIPPALDMVIVPKRNLEPGKLTLAAASAEILPMLKNITDAVLLARSQSDTISSTDKDSECSLGDMGVSV